MLKHGLTRLQNRLFKSVCRLIFLSLVMISLSTVCADDNNNAGDSIIFNRPPDSLANWYSPVAKRHIWLHTMYRLQRAMTAMDEYAMKGKPTELLKWAEIFSEDYQSIEKMVPEWADYLKKDQVEALNAAVSGNKFSLISPALESIGETCNRCHNDYQAITVLLYRSTDFSHQSVRVTGSDQVDDYPDAMRKLADTVNRINIAIKDDYLSDALAYIPHLEERLDNLSANCSNCHYNDSIPVERIFDTSERLLPELTAAIKAKNNIAAGVTLGVFASEFCGRCHSVHRIVSDLKRKID